MPKNNAGSLNDNMQIKDSLFVFPMMQVLTFCSSFQISRQWRTGPPGLGVGENRGHSRESTSFTVCERGKKMLPFTEVTFQ